MLSKDLTHETTKLKNHWTNKKELVKKVMKEFVALRPKMYNYLVDDCHIDKKAKGTKNCVIKQEIKL